MSYEEAAFEKEASEKGWDIDTQISVVLDYIDAQASDDVFSDFIADYFPDLSDGDMGLSVDDVVADDPHKALEAFLTYISNQKDAETFLDHIASAEGDMMNFAASA